MQKGIIEKIAKSITRWVVTLVVCLAISVFIRDYLFSGAYVVGSSMLPTLQSGDILVMSKIPIYKDKIERQDIISIRNEYEDTNYVKRVIGIPGDTIEITGGKVYVNNKEIVEDYLKGTTNTDSYSLGIVELGENEYFVLGDNRANGMSYDSRSFGVVHHKSILGKAEFRYLPLSRASKL